MLSTTPSSINEHVTKLCGCINKATPVYVPVEPEAGAVTNFCFASVKNSQQDGKPLVGWIIWELAGAFIEAEMHCVLERPDGTFVDIVPKPDGETRILFLPDHSHPKAALMLADNNELAPANKRLAIAKTPLIKRFLKDALSYDKIKRGTFVGPQHKRNRIMQKFMRSSQDVAREFT